MKRCFVLCIAILGSFVARPAEAKIIHVPADSTTIQAGINGAVDGDTVLVARGRYYERIDFLGKGILLASDFVLESDTSAIDSTIIDGEGAGSVVVFESGEDSASRIRGFTVTNGNLMYGGGIRCSQSSPVIRDNIISNNWGSGIFCEYCGPTITDNTITENSGSYRGGGIWCEECWATMSNNTIIGNEGKYQGGGIYSCSQFSPVITHNTIAANYGGGEGGGIFCLVSAEPIAYNTVVGNTAFRGGGIFCGSPIIIRNNTIVGNAAYAWGSGIFVGSSSSTIEGNIVANNINVEGVYCSHTSNPIISHNNSWNNTFANFHNCPPGVGDMSWGTNVNGEPCDSFFNISCPPLLCYPDTGDYYLAENSCCVGAGEVGADIGAFGVGCPAYVLGDVNRDGLIDIVDLVDLIGYLYRGAPAPNALPAGDTNYDGEVNLADIVCLLNYVLRGGDLPC